MEEYMIKLKKIIEGFDPTSQGPNAVEENPYPSWNRKMRTMEDVGNDALTVPKVLKAQYMTSDGVAKWETFQGSTAIEDLKKWIDEWVGLNGEISDIHNYIVSTDGVGRIHVQGLKQGELRAILKPAKFHEPEKGYVASVADIAYKLNQPLLFNLSTKEFPYPGEGWGREFSLHYTTPEKIHWTLYFSVTMFPDSGKTKTHIALFYDNKNDPRMRIVRPIDSEENVFVLNGNRETDIKQVEVGLIKTKSILDKFASMLPKQLPDKIS